MRRRLSKSRSFLTCRNRFRGSNIDFYGNLYAIDRIERSLLTFSGDIALRALWSGRRGRRRFVWFRASNRKHRREMTKARVWKTEWKRQRRIYLVVHLAIASSARAHTRALRLRKLSSIDRSFDRSLVIHSRLALATPVPVTSVQSARNTIRIMVTFSIRRVRFDAVRLLAIYLSVIDVIVGTLLARM